MLTKNKPQPEELKYEPVRIGIDPKYAMVGKLRNLQNRLDRIESYLDEVLVKIDYLYVKLKD